MIPQNIIAELFPPSIVVGLVPLIIISLKFRNQPFTFKNASEISVDRKEANIILVSGILLFVLVFKMMTDLPPFMGVLHALGILWIIVSVIHYNKPPIKHIV